MMLTPQMLEHMLQTQREQVLICIYQLCGRSFLASSSGTFAHTTPDCNSSSSIWVSRLKLCSQSIYSPCIFGTVPVKQGAHHPPPSSGRLNNMLMMPSSSEEGPDVSLLIASVEGNTKRPPEVF